jgi:CHASE2 domain-containing sensor protein
VDRLAEGAHAMTRDAMAAGIREEAASWWSFALCVGSLLVLLGLFFVPAVAPALLRLEHWTADWRTAFLSDRLPSSHPDIVIVSITEDTLEPYPYLLPPDRGLMADIVGAVYGAGARAIGLDFYFRKETEADKDEKLQAALRAAKDRLVLGAFERLRPKHLQYQDEFLNRAEARPGYINLRPDRDYVIRYRATLTDEARFKKSFSRLLAEVAGRTVSDEPERIAWLLPPSDGSPTFSRVEAHKLLTAPTEEGARLKDRIVLIGYEWPYLDRYRTPLSLRWDRRRPEQQPPPGTMSGVEIHAHMLAELLDANRSYRELSALPRSILLVVLAGVATVLGLLFRHRRYNFLDWRIASVAVILIDVIIFKYSHLILPFTLAAVAWIAGVTLGTQLMQAFAWSKLKWSAAG